MSFAPVVRILSRAAKPFSSKSRNHLKLPVLLSCLLVIAAFYADVSSAQDISASIRGTVTDESGGAVSGVRVIAVNTETGLQRAAISNSLGAYVLVELPVGQDRKSVV